MAARRDVPGQLFTTWFLCAVDGHDHAVEDHEFAAGRERGQCRAVCGHVVNIAAAIEPNGPLCRACLACLRPDVACGAAPVAAGRERLFFRRLTRRSQAPASSTPHPHAADLPSRRSDPGSGGSEQHPRATLAPTGRHAERRR